MALVKTTKYTTPFTIIANGNTDLPGERRFDSGMRFAPGESGYADVAINADYFWAGYVSYDKGNISAVLDELSTHSSSSKQIQQFANAWMSEDEPRVFVLLAPQPAGEFAWEHFDAEGTTPVLKQLGGGGQEWVDLVQKCNSFTVGDIGIYEFSYVLVSLIKKTANGNYEVLAAYEKADFGPDSQTGLSLTVNLEYVTIDGKTVIENFELLELD